MRSSTVLALAAVLAAGVSLPAQAAWDRIGEVQFSWRGERQQEWGFWGGPVERLNLRARDNGVFCSSVRATFRNGNTRNIFRGYIRQNRSVDVDLPGHERSLRRLDFRCRSEGRRDAQVIIYADIGRYRDEWRRSPDWQRRWSRMFEWDVDIGRAPRDWFHTHEWYSLGRQTFEGRRDREVVFTGGWRGRRIEALALRPLDGDARCWRVAATLANGRTVPLSVRGGEYIRRGDYYQLDLPGHERRVQQIDMTCRAVRDYRVTIELFAKR
ncbi:MAG: hypothetical protein ACT4OG_10645 [Alphaproteobacteria bacterium]